MLLGLDRERFTKISNAGSAALNKLASFADREQPSFAALDAILNSKYILPEDVVLKSLKAVIIESATLYADLLVSTLEASAESVGSNPNHPGEVIPLPEPIEGDFTRTPTFRSNPDFLQLAQQEGAVTGLNSLLSHIERGDNGLMKLLALPGKSIKLISGYKSNIGVMNRIHTFQTQIEGLEIGVDPQVKPPHLLYFCMPQLGSNLAVLEKRYRP